MTASTSAPVFAADDACPCGSGTPFGQCCEPRLNGTAPAETAEALMRSRYTAFVVADAAYLMASWHPDTRPADLTVGQDTSWRRLRIREVVGGDVTDATGEVEFVAHFRTSDGGRDMLHERSRFMRHDRLWVYLDGELF